MGTWFIEVTDDDGEPAIINFAAISAARALPSGRYYGAPEAPYSEPVRDEESPTYRQHMRDAGRGGMLR